jgi:hypothetical protein
MKNAYSGTFARLSMLAMSLSNGATFFLLPIIFLMLYGKNDTAKLLTAYNLTAYGNLAFAGGIVLTQRVVSQWPCNPENRTELDRSGLTGLLIVQLLTYLAIIGCVSFIFFVA